MKKIAIYGAGGLGREVLSLIQALPDWNVVGFYDDGKEKGTRIQNLPVLGGLSELLSMKQEMCIVLAIGSAKVKLKLIERVRENPLLIFPTLIHPSAILQSIDTIKIGNGSIIAAGTVLTTNINIGEHVLLNLNCTIGHDSMVGDCSSVMPGVHIAGEVNIGRGVLIGSGANVLNSVTIGDQSVVGAGSVVTKHVAFGKTVVGIPARSVNTSA